MSVVLTFARDYFIFMLILFLFSYLTPKEDYKKYFQFLIGVMMVAILMRPVLAMLDGDGEEQVRRQVEDIMEECEKGEELYERLVENAGLDTKEAAEAE